MTYISLASPLHSDRLNFAVQGHLEEKLRHVTFLHLPSDGVLSTEIMYIFWPRSFILIGLTLLFNITMKKKWVICLHFFDLPSDGALNSEMIYIYLAPTPSCWFATQSHSSEIQLHLWLLVIFGSKLVAEASAAFFKIQDDDEFCSCDCPTGPLNLRQNSSHEVAQSIENVTKHALYPVSNGAMY
jgi:hypothetical protein